MYGKYPNFVLEPVSLAYDDNIPTIPRAAETPSSPTHTCLGQERTEVDLSRPATGFNVPTGNRGRPRGRQQRRFLVDCEQPKLTAITAAVFEPCGRLARARERVKAGEGCRYGLSCRIPEVSQRSDGRIN